KVGTGFWEYDTAKDVVCGQLTDKTMDDNGSVQCNLRPALALSMLYNVLSSPNAYNNVLAMHWNQRQYNNPKADTIITGPIKPGYTTVVDPEGRAVMQQTEGGLGAGTYEVLLEKPAGPDQERPTYTSAPATTLIAMHGMDHAMWVSTRRFEINQLRQEIFTQAMQLPYYQGLALYLIAVAYPFAALLLILPGKASGFVTIPLAWLWVKSWDIGWAAVIIVDKVLFNNLPPWELPQVLRQADWTDINRLPDILGYGYNYNPLEALHLYYAVLAMVTMSVPAITGAATIRARRGILASFSDASASAASARAQVAGDAFSIKAQNHRNAMMIQFQGWSKLSTIAGRGGVSAGAAGASAQTMGMLAAGAHAVTKTDWARTRPGTLVRNGLQVPSHLAQARELSINTAKDWAMREAKYSARLVSEFHPLVGRYGPLQMFLEAYSSAMAGPGGYELSRNGTSSGAKYGELFAQKMNEFTKARGDFIEHYAKRRMQAGESVLTELAGGKSSYGALQFALESLGSEVLLSAAFSPDSVGKFREWSGGGGMSNREYMLRAWHSGASSIGEALFNHRFVAPGGPGTHLQRMLDTTGGNETTERPDLSRRVQHPDAAGVSLIPPAAPIPSRMEEADNYVEWLHDRIRVFHTPFGGAGPDAPPPMPSADEAAVIAQLAQQQHNDRLHYIIRRYENNEIEYYTAQMEIEELRYEGDIGKLFAMNNDFALAELREMRDRRKARSTFHSRLDGDAGPGKIVTKPEDIFR
ncbi:MAG: hypothetical protein KDD69_00410, partial [Bdellovibrionales bacterium]|nr:hypothetical protein [Bdellovibrionales bacterium]